MRYLNIIKSLLSLSIFIFFALAFCSYHVEDPSFDHATNLTAKNLAGSAGAYIADPILQLFGWPGCLIITLIPLCWAYSYFKHGKVTYWLLKILSAIIAIIATATLLNTGAVAKLLQASIANLHLNIFVEKISLSLVACCSLYYCLSLSILVWTHLSTRLFASLFRIVKILPKPQIKKIKETVTKTNGLKLAPTIQRKQISVLEDSEDGDKHLEIQPIISAVFKSQTVKPKALVKTLDNDNGFILPPTNLLKDFPQNKDGLQQNQSVIRKNKEELHQVLADFGVAGEIIGAYAGPVVTLYELEPTAGTKSSRVIGLADDISRSMRAISARIAVIPGRNAIGIELPNKQRETVYLKELLESKEYQNMGYDLPIILGKDIAGNAVVADLARMPHLLVAGTTGSGKSVAINTMILSLVYALTPQQCKFIMVDPKMLELSVYDGIPHLLTNVVTEPGKAVVALKWVVKEMENRYRCMSNLGVRNVHNYNERIKDAIIKGEVLQRAVQTGFDSATGKPKIEQVPLEMKTLPFIVVIVDEMADLMLVAGKDIETSIQRLAQMARAAGIHIIMATQRPSVDVITGVIKANFPTRISFQVTSKIDSRTILGEQGAEQLLGKGDMLYMAGGSKITRIHGPFVADNEVEKVVSFLKSQGEPDYLSDITSEEANFSGSAINGGIDPEEDDLYKQAVDLIQLEGKASTSFIQRCLKIGYNRAANIIERMEKEGLVSKPNHVGKREIY